jgi:putative FmdB family regulatory protein
LPTYEYHCDSCDRNFDMVQSFHDDPLEACPTCGSPVRKVFGSVGIVFKGSGFYKTDSRTTAKAKAGDGTSASGDAKDGAAPSDGAASSDSNGSDRGDSGSGTGDTSAPEARPPKKESAPKTPSTASSSGNGSSRNAKESAKT